MKVLRMISLVIALAIVLLSLGGSMCSGFDYIRQDRQQYAAGPSREHWLGTDAVGRDRLARLLRGTMVSLSLAPAAAGLSLVLAFLLGAAPGFEGGAGERLAKCVIDLMLAIPWLFLLLIVRALLPLNTSPAASAVITFLMLGLLGWGVPARVLMAQAQRLRSSEFVLLARTTGISRRRLWAIHMMPNLWPVLLSQFWISVPIFILAEANLSLLGMGVAEPMPSLGNLMGELETALSTRSDIYGFSSLLVLFLVVNGLQSAALKEEMT